MTLTHALWHSVDEKSSRADCNRWRRARSEFKYLPWVYRTPFCTVCDNNSAHDTPHTTQVLGPCVFVSSEKLVCQPSTFIVCISFQIWRLNNFIQLFQSLRMAFCLDEKLHMSFLSHLKHHFNPSSRNSGALICSWNFSLFIKTNNGNGQETASAKFNYHFQVEENFINHRIRINIHYTVDEKALCTLLTWAGGTVEKTTWFNSLKYLHFLKLAVIKVPVWVFFLNVYLFPLPVTVNYRIQPWTVCNNSVSQKIFLLGQKVKAERRPNAEFRWMRGIYSFYSVGHCHSM